MYGGLEAIPLEPNQPVILGRDPAYAEDRFFSGCAEDQPPPL